VDLRDYLRILRKRWLLITVCALLSLGAAAGATLLATPMYEAKTELFVSARADDSVISSVYQGSLFAQQRVKSYADIVDSPGVLQPVIDQLHLDIAPSALAKRVSAQVPLDTVLIDVTVSDASPERARDIANAIGEAFASRVPTIEATGSSGAAPVKVTVVKPAEAPESPSSPRTKVNLALGLLVGLAIGVGVAVLRETLDTTLKSLSDLQQITGATPLAVITRDGEASKRPLVVHYAPQSSRAEAFRQLRTNLQFSDVDNPPRMVIVTSAVPGEGKSSTSGNLAITLAQAGQRVILVEADLRRPKMADYFGIERAVGLTNVLFGQSTLEDALQPWGRGDLWLLPSGPLPPNPSEILGSRHMRELLHELSRRADVVLVDTPPLLPVTDAAVLAQAADGAVLVIRHGTTRKEQVRRAVDALRSVDARLLGTVLNGVPTRGADAEHYYAESYATYQTDNTPQGHRLTERANLSLGRSKR